MGPWHREIDDEFLDAFDDAAGTSARIEAQREAFEAFDAGLVG